jgi:hypothetical protein
LFETSSLQTQQHPASSEDAVEALGVPSGEGDGDKLLGGVLGGLGLLALLRVILDNFLIDIGVVTSVLSSFTSGFTGVTAVFFVGTIILLSCLAGDTFVVVSVVEDDGGGGLVIGVGDTAAAAVVVGVIFCW